MKNLYAMSKICLDELHTIGIFPNRISDYNVNYRAKHRWGQCKLSNGKYTINISYKLLEDDVPERALKDTLIHELLHAVDGCMNHGDKWQRLADKVNKAYGYDIKRCTSQEEKGVELCNDKDYHYIITCQGCNTTWKYMRHSKIVKCCQNNTAKCSCGSKKFIVISQ